MTCSAYLGRLLNGFHHVCLTFLSYLSDRVQAVSVNGWVSSHKRLHYRAPQCSVLGPKLYSVHSTSLKTFLEVGVVMTNLLTILISTGF